MRASLSHLYILSLYLLLAEYVFAIPNLPEKFVNQVFGAYDSFYMTNSISAFDLWAPPSTFDFWKEALNLGDGLRNHTEKELAAMSRKYSDVADEIADFKARMKEMVDAAAQLHAPSEQSFTESQDIKVPVQVEEFYEMLSAKTQIIIQEFLDEFTEPLPEDESERYKKAKHAVVWLLNKLEQAFVEVSEVFGISEVEARERFGRLKPHVQHVVLITINIVDKHPKIVAMVIFTGAAMLVPEGLILRPFLGVFGWGPQGPVKGSAAAALQRFFYRKEIPAQSWFSGLQRAGMKWGGRVGCNPVAGAGFAAILAGAFCGCF